MQRIKDPLSYFFSKSKLELEGKILRIDKEKEIKKLKDLNAKKIYSAETKFKWEENTRIEIGSIIEEKRWIELRENYEKTSFLKEREIKSREIYILPGKNGEEYRSRL